VNIERIEELVRRVQELPDLAARDASLELVRAIMEFHEAGLSRLMEVVAEAESAEAAMEAIAGDRLASAMLLAHDLHPLDLETRVRRALDQPEFRSRGASAALVSIEGGAVCVRIEGGRALRSAVESALMEAAPDASSIVVEGGSDPLPAAGFVPLAQLIDGRP
jgi:hypothetical protein